MQSKQALVFWSEDHVTLWQGHVMDVLPLLPEKSIHCVLTSPPYYQQRKYPFSEFVRTERWSEDAPFGNEKMLFCGVNLAQQDPCGECYICRTVMVFQELRKVLRDDGVIWWNVGDSRRAGDGGLCWLPFRLADALEQQGWLVRDMVIWAKQVYEERIRNTVGRCVPESIKGWHLDAEGKVAVRRWRTTMAHEYVLMVVKEDSTYFGRGIYLQNYTNGAWSNDIEHPAYADRFRRRPLRREEGLVSKNLPSVWRISPGTNLVGRKQHYADGGEGHVAVMPVELAELCVQAVTSPEGACAECGAAVLGGTKTCTHNDAGIAPMVVLDPFCGSGTTGVAAKQNGCAFVGIDLNPEYLRVAKERIVPVHGQLVLT